jgi:hypothetical protein
MDGAGALLLWRALQPDALCDALLPRGRERGAWAEVIAMLVIGRLCEPSSELHVAEQWSRTTALEDLLGVSSDSLYDERLYRSLDRLLPHREVLRRGVYRSGEPTHARRAKVSPSRRPRS